MSDSKRELCNLTWMFVSSYNAMLVKHDNFNKVVFGQHWNDSCWFSRTICIGWHQYVASNMIFPISLSLQELKSVLEWKFGQKFRNTTGFEGIVQGITVDAKEIRACGDFRRKTKQIPSGYWRAHPGLHWSFPAFEWCPFWKLVENLTLRGYFPLEFTLSPAEALTRGILRLLTSQSSTLNIVASIHQRKLAASIPSTYDSLHFRLF